MSRPEEIAPPEIFYNDQEARKYTASTRVQHIQAKMTLRALEILNLDPSIPQFILDIGCGSGLSGEILTEEGHIWIGMDISLDMLATALDRDVDGDLFLADMGSGVPFRAGTFDAAISISAIQWLCNADTNTNEPKVRLARFFNTLYGSLRRGAKFVGQFYPANEEQIVQITGAAKVAGFQCGVVIDDPESKKNKKHYLVLQAGASDRPLNLGNMDVETAVPKKEHKMSKKRLKKMETKKQYIKRKKVLMKRRGKRVANDSKFTGRSRRPHF
ncbi:18S rRNA (guanine1575-N7)-methyltransferase [Brettanomyces nanus]|uniref:18S rRNA (Guanine1575-N7)-methyltransferase n=1 Tax=Eeniella nana TaxID=13502 RepID=A0A875S8L5_EENNA|nr:18S rRNA (guanine1575-N7)-methyltransferase [Brettanomyces nanus]QPG76019.1 18S rRNA (guanine1575-N7)-methyltransferase [Brettanomyces nanus]